jgi:DNA replication protein DnaC
MKQDGLLVPYLRHLRLPTFLKNYRQFGVDASHNDLDYSHYLLALAEHKVTQWEKSTVQRRIKAARFPVIRELSDFDFSAITSLVKDQI